MLSTWFVAFRGPAADTAGALHRRGDGSREHSAADAGNQPFSVPVVGHDPKRLR